MRLSTTEMRLPGANAAEEVGTFSMERKAASLGEIVGKYLDVWQEEGGQRKLDAGSWNTNK